MNSATAQTSNGIAKTIFGIDVRSLAALRIGMAIVILYDLIVFRWPFVGVFLTDNGILTREMAEQFIGPGYWSLYSFDGSTLGAQILLITNMVAAGCLLLGFKTKFMTITCLVMAWSLQVRNPLVLSGGDVLLRTLLVWSVFLPTGAAWSLDAWTNRLRRPARYVEVSMATVAILLQPAIMYFFAGVAKCNSYWFDGEALGMAMQLEMYAKPTAKVLMGMSWIFPIVTWGVLVLELVGPWLLFLPWKTTRIRTVQLVLFWMMHLSIWATMSIGIFSAISMISWMVFVPSQFWDRLFGRPEEFEESLPVDYPDIRRLGNLVCAVAIVFCIAINIANVREEPPEWYAKRGALFAKATMLVQEFNLWGVPPSSNPVIRYPAETEDGEVDLLAWYLHQQDSKPDTEFQYMHSQPWRRIHWEFRNESELHQQFRSRLLQWLANHWGEAHQKSVNKATIYYSEKPLGEDEPSEEREWAVYP